MAVNDTPDNLVSLRSQLLIHYPTLKASERRVADFLLSQDAISHDHDLKQLANIVGVSQPTIVRMCQALGYKGYRAFRLHWTREVGSLLAGGEKHAFTAFTPIYDALYQTQNSLCLTSIAAAADTIVDSRQVFIYGIGGSGYVAHLAATTLSIAGRLSVAYTNEALCASSTGHIDDKTAVFVISHRGESSIIEHVVTSGKAVGSETIVLTSNASSSLAQLANVILLTGAPSGRDYKEMAMSPTRIVQLAGIYILAKAVAKKIKSQ